MDFWYVMTKSENIGGRWFYYRVLKSVKVSTAEMDQQTLRVKELDAESRAMHMSVTGYNGVMFFAANPDETFLLPKEEVKEP